MPRYIDRLTKREFILIACYKLSEEHGVFNAETLVVYAWNQDNSSFGLRGYTDLYPDSNRVLANLMGAKGLVEVGYLERVGPRAYKITERGMIKAKALLF